MPNHFHCVLFFNNKTKISLNALIANAKRFLAYKIVQNLEILSKIALLNELNSNVTKAERQKGTKHKIFKTSFDSVIIKDKIEMEKILNYIHNNPCSKKWMLSNSPENYLYSSSKYYYLSEPNIYISDYRLIF